MTSLAKQSGRHHPRPIIVLVADPPSEGEVAAVWATITRTVPVVAVGGELFERIADDAQHIVRTDRLEELIANLVDVRRLGCGLEALDAADIHRLADYMTAFPELRKRTP